MVVGPQAPSPQAYLSHRCSSVARGTGIVEKGLRGAQEEEDRVVEKDEDLYDVLEQLSVRLEEKMHSKGGYHHIRRCHLMEREGGGR